MFFMHILDVMQHIYVLLFNSIFHSVFPSIAQRIARFNVIFIKRLCLYLRLSRMINSRWLSTTVAAEHPLEDFP